MRTDSEIAKPPASRQVYGCCTAFPHAYSNANGFGNEYVVDLNLRRRQLTRDQRAMAAAEAWGEYETGWGGDRRSDQAAESGPLGRTRDVLAAKFKVGVNAAQRAVAAAEVWPRFGGAPKGHGVKPKPAGSGYPQMSREEMAARWEVSEATLKQATALVEQRPRRTLCDANQCSIRLRPVASVLWHRETSLETPKAAETRVRGGGPRRR